MTLNIIHFWCIYYYCLLDHCIQDEVNANLSQTDTLCAFNRSGIICGGGQSGFSLTLGTNERLQDPARGMLGQPAFCF